MKIKPITKVGGIRLELQHWDKLRDLMTHHRGRNWLVKIIEREYKRAFTKAKTHNSGN